MLQKSVIIYYSAEHYRWKNRTSPNISDHAGADSLGSSGFKGVALPW